MGIRVCIGRLTRLRFAWREDELVEQNRVLHQLSNLTVRSKSSIVKLCAALMSIRAFPAHPKNYRQAGLLLGNLCQKIRCADADFREHLQDTGLPGTIILYEFSYEIARWLMKKYPDSVDISWDDYVSPEKLDQVLEHLLHRTEQSAFEEGTIDTPHWLRLAKGGSTKTDLAWLLHEMSAAVGPANLLSEAFTAAEVPLSWRLDHRLASKPCHRLPMNRLVYRRRRLRKFTGSAKQAIEKPMRKIQQVSHARAQEIIDVARAALACRHREVYALCHANPDEVYLATLGENTHVAIIGVTPGARLSLEANYAFLLLSNGIPIGYGGVSPLLGQANTGINIFDEFRGAESATLWVQTLRAFRQLFQCERFMVNPYQFGKGNAEAVGSGAFWFYYKLGFRPIDEDIKRLAIKEMKRRRNRPGYRSDRIILRQLARGDLELRLSCASGRDRFDEEWLNTLSIGVTRLIASRACATRRLSQRCIVHEVCRKLQVYKLRTWPAPEREAFEQLSLVVGLIQSELVTWTRREKLDLVRLMRAKGSRGEKQFATLASNHTPFRSALARYCRHAEK